MTHESSVAHISDKIDISSYIALHQGYSKDGYVGSLAALWKQTLMHLTSLLPSFIEAKWDKMWLIV